MMNNTHVAGKLSQKNWSQARSNSPFCLLVILSFMFGGDCLEERWPEAQHCEHKYNQRAGTQQFQPTAKFAPGRMLEPGKASPLILEVLQSYPEVNLKVGHLKEAA